MPSLQVREVSPALYSALVSEARRSHRSIAQQAVAVLERGMGMGADNKRRRGRVLQALQQDKPKAVGRIPDPVDLVREERRR